METDDCRCWGYHSFFNMRCPHYDEELADILFELGYSVNNEEVLLKNGL